MALAQKEIIKSPIKNHSYRDTKGHWWVGGNPMDYTARSNPALAHKDVYSGNDSLLVAQFTYHCGEHDIWGYSKKAVKNFKISLFWCKKIFQMHA